MNKINAATFGVLILLVINTQVATAKITFATCPSNYQTISLGASLYSAQALCPNLEKLSEKNQLDTTHHDEMIEKFNYVRLVGAKAYQTRVALLNNKIIKIFVGQHPVEHTIQCLQPKKIFPEGIRIGDDKSKLLFLCGAPYKHTFEKIRVNGPGNHKNSITTWQIAHGPLQGKENLIFKNGKLIEIQSIA